jgi:hypothetical protein
MYDGGSSDDLYCAKYNRSALGIYGDICYALGILNNAYYSYTDFPGTQYQGCLLNFHFGSGF